MNSNSASNGISNVADMRPIVAADTGRSWNMALSVCCGNPQYVAIAVGLGLIPLSRAAPITASRLTRKYDVNVSAALSGMPVVSVYTLTRTDYGALHVHVMFWDYPGTFGVSWVPLWDIGGQTRRGPCWVRVSRWDVRPVVGDRFRLRPLGFVRGAGSGRLWVRFIRIGRVRSKWILRFPRSTPGVALHGRPRVDGDWCAAVP